MRLLDDLLRPAWRLLPCAVLAVLLVSCGGGPGTGGTGTGPSFTGASYSTTTGPSGAPGAVFSPTPPAGVACAACDRADLQLATGSITLRFPCGRFRRDGAWDPALADQTVSGTFEAATAAGVPATRPASLRLQFASSADAASPQVTVTVLDANGAVLLGPLVLQRDAAPGTLPAACVI